LRCQKKKCQHRALRCRRPTNAFAIEVMDFCQRNANVKRHASSIAYMPLRLRAATAKDAGNPLLDAAGRTRLQESNRATIEYCNEANLGSVENDANAALQKTDRPWRRVTGGDEAGQRATRLGRSDNRAI